MNKSKILFILHMPPPVHGAAMMGKYIHDSQVINQAFDCRYFNLTLAKDLRDIGKGGIRKFKDFIRQLRNIRQEVKAFRPALCYVTPNAKGGAFYKDFVIVMMLKAMGQKVVIHYHNKGVATRQDKPLDNFLYKRFFKGLKVILLAEPLYQDICKYVKREDVFICPNGIPEQETTPTKTAHEGFNILFLSNMMKEKGVWDLVEACRILKERGKKFHCHFVGKWSDITEEDFLQKIQETHLENEITAHGAKYGTEKNIFFQQADVFVFPTYYHNETFGLVLLEAMEYAIPCISSNEGGVPTVIDEGKTGYVIEKQQPLILAEKIAYLIDHPALSQAMGEAGRKKFKEEFTLERFENRMKEILQEIVSAC
ncbi:glycosyltransferase family 4 protein [Mediterranea massiliensis]|uniref:glycosyltransferase family 4 protein n=1 Tax=Mediterranea massiliensis TaxID=1841865 RepID=UPI0023F328DD|nr:glycosyltransferase family 4 protein [Mediterranea massiliensis]